jgi:hypothetical protein
MPVGRILSYANETPFVNFIYTWQSQVHKVFVVTNNFHDLTDFWIAAL